MFFNITISNEQEETVTEVITTDQQHRDIQQKIKIMKENEGLLNEISAHDVHPLYINMGTRQSASTETPEEATESVAGPSAGLPPNSNNQSTEKCSENVSVNVRGYKDRVNKTFVINQTFIVKTKVHRLGHSNKSDKPRPILVKFKSCDTRDSFWAGKAGLKGTGITVSEFLTKRRQKLFHEARNILGVKNCWTRNGTIIALDDKGKRHSLYCRADLDKIDVSSKPPEIINSDNSETTSLGVSSPPKTSKVASLKRPRTGMAVKKTK
ncbi:hypothetical protein ACJJTC_017629 [Scirpophaga incertulas]